MHTIIETTWLLINLNMKPSIYMYIHTDYPWWRTAPDALKLKCVKVNMSKILTNFGFNFQYIPNDILEYMS